MKVTADHVSFPTDGKVLVLGVPHPDVSLDSHFGNRVYFWDYSQVMKQGDIPGRTAAVIMITHDANPGDQRRARDCASARGVTRVRMANSIGHLRETLKETLTGVDLSVDPDKPVVAKPETPSTPSKIPVTQQEADATQTKPRRRCSLRSFVAEKINPQHKGSIAEEGRRILALAQQEGIQTTSASVAECVRTTLKRMGNTSNVKTPSQGTQTQGLIPQAQPRKVSQTRSLKGLSAQIQRLVDAQIRNHNELLAALSVLKHDCESLEEQLLATIEEREEAQRAAKAFNHIRAIVNGRSHSTVS